MTGLPGTWNEPDTELLDQLTHTAMFAADTEAMKPGPPSRSFHNADGSLTPETPHERTVRIVRATLRMLLANGLITVVPPDERPEWVILDPPEDAAPREAAGGKA